MTEHEPGHSTSCRTARAPSKDSDHPAHAQGDPSPC